MPRSHDRVGAVVLGGDYQGLGIVRSLGRLGVPVCVLDDEYSIARHSRYTTFTVRVRDLRQPAATIAALRELARRHPVRGWVLFPTRDEQVVAISRHRHALSETFRVPTSPWETARWACDKRRTYRLAQTLGIPAPRTWYPQKLDDLDQIEVDGPLVIKPAERGAFFYETKAKAWRANDREGLVDGYRRAVAVAKGDHIMVQEHIPGDGRHQFAYGAFFKNGRAVGSMVAQRRRQHPPDFGRASTFVRTVDEPLLETLSERFLTHINYYGLVELEYKLDPRDGRYKLLDVNARTWGYHTLGYAAGVDFPALLFADQIGTEDVAQQRTRPGVRWVRLVTDVPTGLTEMSTGDLGLRAYLRSLRGTSIESVLTRNDPLPGIAEFFYIPYLAVHRGF